MEATCEAVHKRLRESGDRANSRRARGQPPPAGISHRRRGRCHCRRRRAVRLGYSLLPGQIWSRRAAPGKDQVPQGEGLRRRADSPRGQGASGHGHPDRRAGRLAAQQGPADHRRRRPARADLASYPGFGLVRSRLGFDETLARSAQKSGARLIEGMNVSGPVRDDKTGRLVGVTASEGGAAAGGDAARDTERTYRARVVVAADGNSSRLSVAMGLRKREDRPLGVAVRTYYTSPRHDDDYLESWLELWDGDRLLPGYGWIFGMGDGTSNVGLGMLNTSDAFGKTDYRELLKRWLKSMPEEWGYVEENRTEPVRGAALPMGFNRTPHYYKGLLLTGDAAGMVNPFNGEGIAYAMESGELLARVVAQALARPTRAETERVLRTYPQELQAAYGRYYTLGRIFVELIGRPKLMRYATSRGMHHPQLMRFALKLLANLTDPRDGDAGDRIISAMTRLAPTSR